MIKPGFKPKNNVSKNCNCHKSNKVNCPLQGNCLIKNIVYKVRVKYNLSDGNNKNNYKKDKFYIGSTGGHFKDRYTGQWV